MCIELSDAEDAYKDDKHKDIVQQCNSTISSVDDANL